MTTVAHHPLIEEFFSGQRSSAGLAEIVFAPAPARRRCAVEGCRRLVAGSGPAAKWCPAHQTLARKRKYREYNRKRVSEDRTRAYLERGAASPDNHQTGSDPLTNPLIDAAIVR